MPLLVARDVWAAPPGASEPVLRGFSLELAAGEWLAVSGPNGGGKTTLALVLAGLWAPSRGRVELEGVPVALRRAEIAVVLQDPATQLLTSSVGEELAATARNLSRPADEIERRVREWSARFALEAELARDPRTLSAGRQQLVLLAAALIAGPRLLIADEPAVHLDPSARGRALTAIREQVDRGLAVAWITQAEAERAAADRRLWLGEAPRLPSEATAPLESSPGTAVRLRIRRWEGDDGPRVRVSRPLDLDLPLQGIRVLTGPNGCGKSVILAAAAGLIESPQWTLEWLADRQPLPLLASQYPEQQIFEEKVEDELIFAALSRGLKRSEALDRAGRALAALGFDRNFMGRRCWWLSGGERRLVEVVAALIAPASLLALDEPTAGLDDARRLALRGMVRERARTGPVLVATQDLEWASGLGGQVTEVGLGMDLDLPSLSKKMD